MSNNPRDTQFKGFAEALFCDLPWHDINIDMDTDGWEDRWEALIARRAYDLVAHIIRNLNDLEPRQSILTQEEADRYHDELLAGLPDLPELPKEPES